MGADTSNKFSRRDFIKVAGIAFGGAVLLPCCSPEAPYYRVFSKAEADCLIAMCEQIIPADHDGGATDAGVIHFIDKQTALRFPGDLETFQQGIASVQANSKARYGRPFEELESAAQVELMELMERNGLPEEYWQEVGQQTFFNLVRNRTMQGFYGSPRHGGNKDYMSYRMLGLDYPLLIGQNRYRNNGQ